MLLMEFHGTAAGVEEQAATVQEIAREHGGARLRVGDARRKSARGCGHARHHAYLAGLQMQTRLPLGDDRHLRADLAPGRMHRRDDGRGRGRRPAVLHRRPRRRRQFPRRLPDRSRIPAERETAERLNDAAGRRARCGGRHLHRRARHRPAQAGFPDRRSGRRRGRDDAHDQAGARPEQHHEPGQDLSPVEIVGMKAWRGPAAGTDGAAAGRHVAGWRRRFRGCTPKPHNRATCLSTSCALSSQRPVVVLRVAQGRVSGRRAGSRSRPGCSVRARRGRTGGTALRAHACSRFRRGWR